MPDPRKKKKSTIQTIGEGLLDVFTMGGSGFHTRKVIPFLKKTFKKKKLKKKKIDSMYPKGGPGQKYRKDITPVTMQKHGGVIRDPFTQQYD